jgi:hypothetical protein
MLTTGHELTADTRLESGRNLFNAGHYFEAHDHWEDLWNECPAADRRFVQSLIQAAVALHHAGNGNRAGAETLLARGRGKVEGDSQVWNGLNWKAFWESVERTIHLRLARWPESANEPGPKWFLEPETQREETPDAE